LSFKYLLCDLDNTLYSNHSGMLDHIDHRIDNFIQQKLNLTTGEITRLRNTYWQKYGTTLTGLMLHHHIKPDEYIQNAYNINIADFLKPDSALAKVLENISFAKAIFSNSPREYIQKVLQVLKIDQCFSKIYDIEFCNYSGKPNSSSYRKVLVDLGIQAKECILVDDSLVNIQAAEKIGIVPIYINRDDKQVTHWEIREIYDLDALVSKLIQSRISA
jgi:putative hydrolase of the HAD superfamily